MALSSGALALRAAEELAVAESQARPSRERWAFALMGYKYAIVAAGDAEEEIIAWHWHPWTAASFPHVHIGGNELATRHLSRRDHIPTGHITIDSVARFLFSDLGVAPARDDWDAVLQEAREQLSAARRGT